MDCTAGVDRRGVKFAGSAAVSCRETYANLVDMVGLERDESEEKPNVATLGCRMVNGPLASHEGYFPRCSFYVAGQHMLAYQWSY